MEYIMSACDLSSVVIQVWQVIIWLFLKTLLAIYWNQYTTRHTLRFSISVLLWCHFDRSHIRFSTFPQIIISSIQNLQGQTAMKNLTLILAMSLGLFVLGTFANSDPTKAMYKRLPLSFKDNGELRCPGSKIQGPRKDLLTKNLLNRFGITVATRFQVICS